MRNANDIDRTDIDRTDNDEPVGDEPVDGRVLRGQRTHDAILDALTGLFRRTRLNPTAHEIATEAGVSVRTLYLHFDDLQLLHTAAVERVATRLLARIAADTKHLLERPDAAERIRLIIEQREAFWTELWPVATAMSMQASSLNSAPIIAAWNRVRDALRDQMHLVFLHGTPQVDPVALPAIYTVFSMDTWRSLRMSQQLTASETAEVLEHLARRCLGVPDPARP